MRFGSGFRALLLTGALLSCSPPAQVSTAARPRIAITGVTVVDPSRATPLTPDQTILIEGDRITTVGPARSVRVPDGARVVDGRGKYAMPGLWDAHVHFMNTGVSALPVLVANGVTSVREMGGFIDSTRAWQRRMAVGTLVGPRIRTPGPILESPRYLANVRSRDSALAGRLVPRVLPYRMGVADSADARRAIDSLVKLGVDFVKIRTVASPQSYAAILREAKRAGLTVVGHSPGVVSITAAAIAGQRTIEHAFLPPTSTMSDSARAALYAAFATNETWYTPTLTVSRSVLIDRDSSERLIWPRAGMPVDSAQRYASDWLLGWWRMQVDERTNVNDSTRATNQRAYRSSAADVRAMQNAGVGILAGTDAGSVLVYPGFSLHEELRLLVEDAGLTTREALVAATIAPAKLFAMESQLGTIAAGKLADIVLLDGDPIASIRNTRRISAVIAGGRLFDRPALDALLRASERR